MADDVGRCITDPDEMLKHLAIEGRARAGNVRKDDAGLIVTKYAASPTLARLTGEKSTGTGLPEVAEVRRLATERGIEFADEDMTRVFPWWGSDERVDSQGDIVRQAGWDFGLVKKNGPVLFGHRSFDPPIGRILSWEVRNRVESDYQGPALWLLNYFGKGDDVTDRVVRLIKGGILTSGSVGFRAREILVVEDEEERKKLGLGRWGVVVTKAQLFEYSVVSVPANDGATVIRSLTKAKEDGALVDATDVQLLRDLARDECAKASPDSWRKVDDFYRGAGQFLFPSASWKSHKDVEAPIIKRGDDEERKPVKPADATLIKMALQMETMASMMGLLTADVREIKDRLGDCTEGHGEDAAEGPSPSSDGSFDPFGGK